MATSEQRTLPIGSRQRALGWSERLAAASADRPWLTASALFVISVLTRLPYLNRPALFDEYYTILAARGMLTDGVPRIADGVYNRAELFTRLVAALFDLFGESLIVARLPSVVAGSLLVAAVFVWTRSVAGSLAAWFAALFLCLSPLSIEMAQFARFYALVGLALWLVAIGVYTLATRRLTWAPGLAVAGLSGAAFWITWLLEPRFLQPIMLGLVFWLLVAVALPWLTAHWLNSRWRWAVLGTVTALLLLTVAVVGVQTGFVPGLLDEYLFVPMHMAEHGREIWYYHLLLIERYPTFWPLFPFIALVALAAKPRPTIFCLCIFSIIFVLLSFAGPKSLRYLFFAMPFLFIIWGIALAESFRALRSWVANTTNRALDTVAPGLPRRPAQWVLVIAGLAFLVVSSGAPARTLLLPFGIRLNEAPFPDWSAAKPLLEPWLDEASVVLTTHELHTLYHLGRYDALVSKERLFEISRWGGLPSFEIEPNAEFILDPRTGRPVVGTPEAVDLILDCYPDGLIITDTIKGWRSPTVIDEATANVIARRTTPIDLPAATQIRAFRWERPDGAAVPASCAAVAELVTHKP